MLTAVVCAAGLTKVPIDGQPKSIVQDLEEMARTYIKVGTNRGPASLVGRVPRCRLNAG